MKSQSFFAGRKDYRELFRKHVSRKAAGKEKAVLEGVGLDNAAIETCFRNNPLDVVEAVQSGLIVWSSGYYKEPTWEVLLGAMEHAQIEQQHIQDLRQTLAFPEGVLSMQCSVCCWQ